MTEHVELIREAARLIRQRAEAATNRAPLPWRQTISDSESPTGVGICEDHRQAEPMWPCENCWAIETWSEPVAEHIASWHPGVALLVADWLDVAADLWEPPKQTKYYSRRTASQLAALAMARAYLGKL